MQQSGEYRIGARIEAVWRALNDPEVLSRCIDGCQSMTRTAGNAFAAQVKARIGPLSAVFSADVTLTDIVAPTAYTLKANVRGGAAGFAKGSAKVTLTPDGEATMLRFEVEGSVGGKLAQIGQRLVDGAARQMADDFFARFSEILAPAPESAPTTEAAQPKADRRGFWAAIAAAVAALIAAAVYLLLGRRAPK